MKLFQYFDLNQNRKQIFCISAETIKEADDAFEQWYPNIKLVKTTAIVVTVDFVF